MHITINSRPYSVISSIADDVQFSADKNYLFDLDYLGGLLVKGERAQEFLQGQVSCDVRQINNNTMRQGVMCNLQGRILAALDIVQREELSLVLPKDLLTATQKTLSKPAMLSRVSIQATDDLSFLGLYVQNPADLIPWGGQFPQDRFAVRSNENGSIYNLGNNLYVLMSTATAAAELKAKYQACHQFRGSFSWHALKLKHKQIEIYPETRGLFLPHRLDLHLTGYLNFDKGCYKGQEIIARTHYRAKLKHHLNVFIIKNNKSLSSGDRLLKPNTELELGEVIDYSPRAHEEFLVAVSILNDHPNEVEIAQNFVSLLTVS